MPYTEQTWVDLPSTITPLDAARMQHLEAGLAAATATADEADAGVKTLLPQATLPVIREVLHGAHNDGQQTPISLTTSSGTLAGDTLLLVHGNDWNYSEPTAGSSNGMVAPGGTVSGWTLVADAGNGLNVAHLKVWKATVSAAGAETVTVAQANPGSDSYFASLYVLGGAVAVESATAVRGTASTSHTAPSQTAAGGNRMLLCAWQSVYSAGGGDTTYTSPPTGMTQQTLDREGNLSAGTGAMLTATKTITIGGPIAPQTATYADSRGYAAASLVLTVTNNVLTDALAAVPTLEELEAQARLGDISSVQWPPLNAANLVQRIAAASLVTAVGVTASDTNYWTVELVRWQAGTASTIATRTTQTTGINGGITAYVPWTFDLVAFTSAQYLNKGDVFGLKLTPTGTPAALTALAVSWRYEPGVTA